MHTEALLVLALAACEPQVDGGYPGETIAVLPGTVLSPGDVVVDGMQLFWQGVDPRGPGAVKTTLPVRTRFPSGFEASLTAPPPVEARLAFDGEPAFAEGCLYALAWRGRSLVPAGTDYGRALVWLAADAAPGTTTAAYLGGPLAAGFHVVRWTPTAELSPAQEILAARCVAAALALGWGEEATTVCREIRSFRLDEDPEGMAAVWMMYVLGGPR
jgi:hypothetical protein